MHSPEIIFLDEPTSGLDPQSMKAIHKIILFPLMTLVMENIKPWQYLTEAGIYVWGICMVEAGVIASGFHYPKNILIILSIDVLSYLFPSFFPIHYTRVVNSYFPKFISCSL